MKGQYIVTKRTSGFWWRCMTCSAKGGPYPERHVAEHKAGGHFFFVCGRGRDEAPTVDLPMIDRDG